MTLSLKHKFQSAIPDAGDPTIVQPSNWNDEHALTQATATMLGRVTAGTGVTEELTPAQARTLLNVADGATANSSDAFLLARANHTGTESADVLTDGTTNKAFLATERTKLAGIAASATANSPDATLLARANHTGTQLASTISDFATAADARIVAALPVLTLATTTDLAAATVPVTVKTVRVSNYSVLDDGGGHLRQRVAAQPTWGGIRSVDRFMPDGSTDNTNGGWWDVDEAQPNECMFGGSKLTAAGFTDAQQTTAIQALLDYSYNSRVAKAILINRHTITATINVPAGITFEWANGFPSGLANSQLTKGFNGDMMTINDGTRLIRPQLSGNGGTFTGKGIIVNSGNNQYIEDPFIIGMQDSCLDFPTGGVGVSFTCIGGYLSRQTSGDPAVTGPASELTTTGYRFFYCTKIVNSVYRFNQGVFWQIQGGYSAGLDFTGNTTGRVTLSGFRCANALTTVLGTQHHISHTSFGGAVTLDVSANNIDFSSNIVGGTLTCGNTNGSVADNVISSGGLVIASGAINNSFVGNLASDGTATIDNSASNTNLVIDATMVKLPVDVLGNGHLRVKNPAKGIGYATGAGGTVTQATSKSTGVSLNTSCGQITMNAAALAAGTIVSFVLTNTAIAATDILVLNHISGGTPGSYSLNARAAAGSATIDLRNNTAGSLSEAIVIAFAVVKAVTA
ncbi:hypothetical protein [Mesorhizobium sp. M8A.F.Ca.ET.165.01.1.1]|uniref:hypothetical protein n=1 Tax=Mesorhizobium sp. M8A.F.Ca.ET.165.01.1.1 TaxID=2563960 RepID=UPI001AEEA3B1|nr:hypothetical protein [Mesorhizobium sp. M8A.F.Ca.ET.165.01.1.1]